MDNEKVTTVSICFNHRWNEGMAERILKVFPNVTHFNMKQRKCVACQWIADSKEIIHVKTTDMGVTGREAL